MTSFWRSWSWEPSPIEKLLDNEHVSLEQLMDEDEILSEIKSQNKKLVDLYVTNYYLFAN